MRCPANRRSGAASGRFGMAEKRAPATQYGRSSASTTKIRLE
jgi:hypothetical protein